MAVPANESYFTPGPRLLKWITRAHIELYERTGGWLGGTLFAPGEEGTRAFRAMHMLVLATTGRKTGVTRKVTLAYFQVDDRLLIIASNGASEQDPAWYSNLVANPEVHVQIGGARLSATARPLEGADYTRTWARHTDAWPRWRVYQDRISRRIPMVELCLHGPRPTATAG
jgi:deazaflavin-dependent oxidoreductase (nitroreductase family)